MQWERIAHALCKRGGCVELLADEEREEWAGMAEFVRGLRGRPMHGAGEAREWASRLRLALDARKRVVAAEGRMAWKSWVRDQIRRGGGALHAFAKRVVERAEEAVHSSEGRCGSPQSHVEADREEWDKTWQKLRGVAAAPWREETAGIQGWASLPPPSVKEMRWAARRFQPYTGIGADLFRPHWFA